MTDAEDIDQLRKELLGDFQPWFANEAQKALANAGDEEEAEIVE